MISRYLKSRIKVAAPAAAAERPNASPAKGSAVLSSIVTSTLKRLVLASAVTGLLGLSASAALPAVASAQETKCSEQGVEPPCYVLPANEAYPITFKSTTEGVKRLFSTETVLGKIEEVEVECSGTATHKSAEDEGTITGPKSDTDTVHFYKCKEVKPVNTACHSTSPAGGAEEIITKTLATKPVWLNAGKTVAGIDLEGEKVGTERIEAEFVCGLSSVKVTESVLGEVPAALYNKQLNKSELKFECEAGKATKQKYREYWPGPVSDFLLSNGHEACEAETAPDVLTETAPAGGTVELKTN